MKITLCQLFLSNWSTKYLFPDFPIISLNLFNFLCYFNDSFKSWIEMIFDINYKGIRRSEQDENKCLFLTVVLLVAVAFWLMALLLQVFRILFFVIEGKGYE